MAFPHLLPIKLSHRQVRFLFFAFVTLGMLGSSFSSYAQNVQTPLGFDILNGIGDVYKQKHEGWGSIIRVYAIRLFMGLAAIDFGWMAVSNILDKREADDMLFSLAKKLMTLSFFLFLLLTANTWIPQIINSFIKIGQHAGKATAATPDGIMADGYDAALGVFQILHELKITEQIVAVLPACVIALLIFLAFLFVAAQLLVCLIESYIAIGAGIILMGFGGSRWTTDMASKYMQYAVATGVKLMVLYIIVGTGQALFSQIHLVSGDQFIPSMLKALGASLVYAYLAVQIPAMASAMMSGSPSLSAGGMAGAAIGAGAAIAGVGAAAVGVAKAGASAAGGAAVAGTGVAKAIGAGIESGMDYGKSGVGLAAHAVGEAGKHGLGLAAGAIGDKVAGGAATFAQAVDGSAGGQIASSIQASRGGAMSGVAGQSAPPETGAIPLPGGPGGSASAPGAAGAGIVPAPSSSAPASPNTAASPAASGLAGAASASSDGGTSAGTSGGPNPSSVSSGASEASSRGSSGAGSTAPPSAAPPASAPAGGSGGAPLPAPGPGTSAPSSPSPLPAAAPGAPAPVGTLATGGDASTGSVSGGTGAAPPSGRDYRDSLHHKIQDLKGYVPDDAAHAATINIDLKHTE